MRAGSRRGHTRSQICFAHSPTNFFPPIHTPPRIHTRIDADDPTRVTDQTRSLGLVVCRGTAVTLVAPTAGMEEIANPFLAAAAEGGGGGDGDGQ